MRVLFMTVPAKTHLYTTVTLAWAMHGAGHEVVIACPPEEVAETQRTGIPTVPVGPRLDLSDKLVEMQKHPEFNQAGIWTDIGESRQERWTWDFVAGLVRNMSYINLSVNNDEIIDDVVRFARGWRPDLVVWDPMMFAGSVAARAIGVPHARLMWGLDLMGRMRKNFLGFRGLAAEFWTDPMAEWLTPVIERYGKTFDEELLNGVWTIDQMPPWMRVPVGLDTLSMRFTPYNGPASIPQWALEKPQRPRVCVSFGLTDRNRGEKPDEPLPAIIEAVSDLDIEVIATLDEYQLKTIGTIPDNVRVVEFTPLRTLMPTCSAVVHHGGGGTFGNALLHGVPQLVVPDHVWDTTLTGQHLAERGMGLCVLPGEYTPAILRENLVRLLEEPSFRAAAEEARKEAEATPSPNDVVRQLEQLVAEYRLR